MHMSDRALVEAARRLVCDNEPRRGGQVAAENELLKIAAREQTGAPLESGTADIVALNKLLCVGARCVATDHPEAREARRTNALDDCILPNAHVADDAESLA